MRSIHLTLMVFCHVLLASVVLYFTSLTTASPLFAQPQPQSSVVASIVPPKTSPQEQAQLDKQAPQLEQKSLIAPPAVAPKDGAASAAAAAPKPKEAQSELGARSAAPVAQAIKPVVEMAKPPKQQHQQAASPTHQVDVVAPAQTAQEQAAPRVEDPQPALTERKVDMKEMPVPVMAEKQVPLKAVVEMKQDQIAARSLAEPEAPQEIALMPSAMEQKKVVEADAAPTSPLATQQVGLVKPPASEIVKSLPFVPQPAALVAEPPVAAPTMMGRVEQFVPPVEQAQSPASSVVIKEVEPAKEIVQQQQQQQASPASTVTVMADKPVVDISEPEKVVVSAPAVQQAPAVAQQEASKPSPVVMGGLGPLHLLATTLCSYQPDKPVADENLNQLYARRASVRKSLFEFMSLKFTNLEKLSSRLGYGLQVVPVKSSTDNKSQGLLPSHGWPVVGKCTAHDLKLMGEAAWCECNEGEQGCNKAIDDKATATSEKDEGPPKITSNHHINNNRVMSARSIDSINSFLPSPEESSVISKILHVSDMKDAPTVENSIYNLNLTQHQLATLEAHATSTQECRRNALRYTKALFNHLSEDQKSVSETWPQLYALVSADDCARKRMIDIVNALSGFRTDTTSIRRDNLEFAFAMDDLRAKVLESEVNVPLTFDRHFIEVEQFLQQSVRLMLANIQPKRAKLTSMRYRSLMYGTSQQSSDDQCIDLHQRLLARNYPNDCNPTQFGQLPDVLRMTASSLELWSIEKALSMHTSKVVDYPNSNPAGQQKVKEDVNECIANLVAS